MQRTTSTIRGDHLVQGSCRRTRCAGRNGRGRVVRVWQSHRDRRRLAQEWLSRQARDAPCNPGKPAIAPGSSFGERAATEVACSYDCQPPSALHDAVPLSLYSLEADAVLYPARPSLSAFEGRVTVVVRVRNPTPMNAYIPPGAFSETQCAFGFMLSSVADPRRTDLDCYYLEFDPISGGVYFPARGDSPAGLRGGPSSSDLRWASVSSRTSYAWRDRRRQHQAHCSSQIASVDLRLRFNAPGDTCAASRDRPRLQWLPKRIRRRDGGFSCEAVQ